MTETAHIARIRQETAVRLAFFKHRGDIAHVQAETGFPLSFIERIIQQLKVQSKKDAPKFFTDTVQLNIFLGHEQRRHYLEEMLREIGSVEIPRSLCCDAAVVNDLNDGSTRHRCIECGNPCDIQVLIHEDVYKDKAKAIELLRKEDEALVVFLEKMRVFGDPPDTQKGVTINIGGNDDNTDTARFPRSESMEIEIAQLPQKDRIKLVRRLEKSIQNMDVIDAEFETKKQDG